MFNQVVVMLLRLNLIICYNVLTSVFLSCVGRRGNPRIKEELDLPVLWVGPTLSLQTQKIRVQ